MMPKVLIVEDKMIVAQDIKTILESMQCIVSGIASSGESAIEAFQQNAPDIILMDIRLKGDMDGIEASKKILELGNASIIYLTAHSNPKILQSAFETQPVNYLVKPFSEKELEIAIGLATASLKKQKNKNNYILFRHNGILERIPYDEIFFAKAYGSYTTIHTNDKSYTASFNLNHFEAKVDDRFFRIHRSFVVSLDKIERYSSHKVFMGKYEIPVSRTCRQDFLSRFQS
ncbi:MAG: LytR/AlgR family response regulator transcription factor [Bacteroidota bacterium]